MSDYEHSRYSGTFPPNAHSTGGSGFFWPMVVVAAIALFVVLLLVGGGPGPVEHPGGAGAEPIVVPTEPEPLPSATSGAID